MRCQSRSYESYSHTIHRCIQCMMTCFLTFKRPRLLLRERFFFRLLLDEPRYIRTKNDSACLVSPFKVTPFLGHEFKQPLKLKPTEVYTEIASGASFLFLLFSFLFHLPDSKSFRTSYALSISFTDLLVPVLLTTFSSANMASASSKHDKIPTFLHNLAVYTQS